VKGGEKREKRGKKNGTRRLSLKIIPIDEEHCVGKKVETENRPKNTAAARA